MFIQKSTTVYAAFVEAESRFGPRPFLRVPITGCGDYSDSAIEYSYTETGKHVQKFIRGYAALGIVSGDRVAVAFDSRLNTYLHLLALNAIGASIVPLNSAATDAELTHLVGHSDARCIVALPELAARLSVITSNMADCNVLDEAELTSALADAELPEARSESEAALLYTSGTTGKPKGCMLSNEYFLRIGEWYNELGDICTLDQNDRLLTPLPPNHMNALCTSFVAMMLCGGCVVQMDRFHPRSWWQTVRDENITVLHCLGVMTAILLTLPEDENEDLSTQVKFAFAPGSDPRHQQVFENRFGFPLIEAWAMTETGGGGMTIAYREPRNVGTRCIGKAVESTEFRIVDESGQDVLPGEPGEFLVRSKGGNPRQYFFSGYYKDESATEAGWDGGWWHTGDVVRQGEDGQLYFVDRRKNVIRRSGENIAAVEVEAALLQIDSVDNCAVCAVPDEIRGDEVFAFVVGGELSALQVFNHCYAELSYFKAPGYIAFVEQLPLTGSNKIRRGDIKTMAAEHLATGDFVDLREFKKRAKSA